MTDIEVLEVIEVDDFNPIREGYNAYPLGICSYESYSDNWFDWLKGYNLARSDEYYLTELEKKKQKEPEATDKVVNA